MGTKFSGYGSTRQSAINALKIGMQEECTWVEYRERGDIKKIPYMKYEHWGDREELEILFEYDPNTGVHRAYI
jgi:hypothetical protein